MKRILFTTALSLSLLTTASAFASNGYVRGNVGMYAGPDEGYPSVFMLSAGTAVVIEGCVDGWSWCDVDAGYNRGWVPGSYLQEEYGGQLVLVPAYGVQIGIPIVAFVFGTYWDNYYRNRAWYGERTRWSNFRPQYRSASAPGGSYGNVGHSSYGHAQVSGSPVQHSVATKPNAHTAGSSAALAPQHSRASTVRSKSATVSHGPTAQSHVSVRHSVASAPAAHAIRSSTASAPQHSSASTVRSRPATVSHGPAAQSHVSAPRATQRAASTRVVSSKGNGQDEAKH